MRTIYAVQTIDRTTGAESTVRVEATSPDEARKAVLAMGEVVGSVKLAEIVKTPAAVASAPPGSVASVCPKCGGTGWTGGRGLMLWILVVLVFPIGLLLLFIQPRWMCNNCGYAYSSYSPPAGIKRANQTIVYQVFRGILIIILVVLLLILLWVILG